MNLRQAAGLEGSAKAASILEHSPRNRVVAMLLVVAVALAAATLPAFVPLRYVFLATELLIAVLYATSLNLLMGYGGMLSLGHAAYYALGAYTSGLLFAHFAVPMVPAMALGPVVAAFGALIFGFFIVRISHEAHAYFLMLTLAFSQLVFAMIYKGYSITRGDDGISGIEPTGIIASPKNFYIFVVVVVAISLFALWRIVHSSFGLTLQAIRDNPQRAEFVGLSVRRYQLTTFIIAGLFAGVAGSLFAFFNGTISPQLADWGTSARPFIANTIGGIQSFWGPAIGVVVLEVLDTQASRLTEHSLIAVGFLAILVGVFLPQGVVGLLTRRRAG